jgi:hypothetical protein
MAGTDLTPFGLLGLNTRLIPFQITGETGTATVNAFEVINATDETIVLTQSTSLLEVSDVAPEGWFVTWKATVDLDEVPDCGFWYIRVQVGSTSYYSDVLHLPDVNANDVVGFELGDCNLTNGILELFLESADTLTGTVVSESFSYFDPAQAQWYSQGGADCTIQFLSSANGTGVTIPVKREVTLSSGKTISRYGEITYTDDSSPCSDAVITLFDQEVIDPTERWLIKLVTYNDTAHVLNQTGYQQYLYLPIPPIMDRPDVSVDEGSPITNGYGQEISQLALIQERGKFEVSHVPDYCLGPLTEICYTADVMTVTDILSGIAIALTDIRFEARAASPQWNVGIFTFKRSEITIHCREDFEIL